MRRVLVLLAGLMAALPAAAAPLAGPPQIEVELPPEFSKAAKNPAAGEIRLGAKVIPLEKMKIQDLANQLKNPVGERSDASTSLHWVCITAGAQRFWFTSDDLGGGKINGVAATTVVAGEKADPSCRNAAAASSTLKLPNGLAVGMDEAALRTLMGKPSYDRSGVLGWLYEKRLDEGTTSAQLWVRTEAGKVSALAINTVTGL